MLSKETPPVGQLMAYHSICFLPLCFFLLACYILITNSVNWYVRNIAFSKIYSTYQTHLLDWSFLWTALLCLALKPLKQRTRASRRTVCKIAVSTKIKSILKSCVATSTKNSVLDFFTLKFGTVRFIRSLAQKVALMRINKKRVINDVRKVQKFCRIG